MPAPNHAGPVDYPSLVLTTVSNVTMLLVVNATVFFQWIGYASILIGFLYNLVKFGDWLRRAKFLPKAKKLFSNLKNSPRMSNTTSTTTTAPVTTDSHPVPVGMAVKVSKKFSLLWQNYLKAFYIAVIVPLIVEVLTGLQSGNFKPNWAALASAGVSAAAAYLIKTYFSTSAIVVKTTTILLICMLGLTAAKAQSVSITGTLTNALPDSISKWKGFRLTGPAAVYGYNKSSGSTLLTGVGLAYTWQHLTSSSTWWVDEAVGIMAYAGGSQAPSSLAMVAAAGPYVSFFNGFLSVGGAINFTTGKPMLTVGAVLPLISN